MKEIKEANKKLDKLVKKIILNKRRKFDGHKLQVRTGDLSTNIKSDIKIIDNNIIADVKVVDYFKWLDGGTKRIKPWALSDAIMDDPDFEELLTPIITEQIEGAIFKSIDRIND